MPATATTQHPSVDDLEGCFAVKLLVRAAAVRVEKLVIKRFWDVHHTWYTELNASEDTKQLGAITSIFTLSKKLGRRGGKWVSRAAELLRFAEEGFGNTRDVRLKLATVRNDGDEMTHPRDIPNLDKLLERIDTELVEDDETAVDLDELKAASRDVARLYHIITSPKAAAAV